MSFFESFLGGAAQAGTGILQDQMKEEQALRMEKIREELALDRARTINAWQQENAIAAEKRGIENRATERGQIRTEEIADEPRKRESKAADYKASEMAKYDPEIQALQRKAETEKLTAKEQAELDFYTKNRTGIIGQKRDMARAAHIDDGAGLRAVQIEAANMTLAEKKDAQAKLNEYETTKDPKRKMELREALVLRGVIKPKDDEYGTEKVTEKTTDQATGKEITVERKQRMGAGGKQPGSDGLDKDLAKMIAEREAAKKPKGDQQIIKRTDPTVSATSEPAPKGDILVSRNPATGKTIYTVDGVRGRFNTREEAEAAKRKSGIGTSTMGGMIDRFGD